MNDCLPKDAKTIDDHVGQRLKAIRKSNGLSQEKLAEIVGLSYQQIQKYEGGLNRISAGRLLIFSIIFEVDLREFYTGWQSGQIR